MFPNLFYYTFRQLSKAKQKTTRYAGGRKEVIQKISPSGAIRLFRPIAKEGEKVYGKPNKQFDGWLGLFIPRQLIKRYAVFAVIVFAKLFEA